MAIIMRSPKDMGLENVADAGLQPQAGAGTVGGRPHLDRGFDSRTVIIFLGLLGAGLVFVAYSLYENVDASGAITTTFLLHLLLFSALLIVLSRSNMIQSLASVVGHVAEHDETDCQIRLELPSRLQQQSWNDFGSRNDLNSLILRSEG